MRRWATPAFTVVLIVIAAIAWGVLQEAQSAVLESQSGSVTEVENDPTAPGFRAFTEPTPTGLVLHTAIASGGGAQLAGATVLLSAGDIGGGTVVSVPASLGRTEPIGQTFQTDGFVAVLEELETIFGIGFGEVVVLDGAAWTSLMAEDLPLAMTLRVDLVDEAGAVLVRSGTREFSLQEVARIASHQNPSESALNVAERQQNVWQAWIGRTAASPDLPPELAVDEGFLDVISALTENEVAYRVAENRPQAPNFLAADVESIQALVAALVPFPESAEPGDRTTVMLLDGTSGDIDQRQAISDVVASGGLVTVLGNTSEPVEASVVQVHNPDSFAFGQTLASLLGSEVEDVPADDAPTDVTVIIGADLIDGP